MAPYLSGAALVHVGVFVWNAYAAGTTLRAGRSVPLSPAAMLYLCVFLPLVTSWIVLGGVQLMRPRVALMCSLNRRFFPSFRGVLLGCISVGITGLIIARTSIPSFRPEETILPSDALAAVVGSAVASLLIILPHHRIRPGRCFECDYDITRSLESGRCPECGSSLMERAWVSRREAAVRVDG